MRAFLTTESKLPTVLLLIQPALQPGRLIFPVFDPLDHPICSSNHSLPRKDLCLCNLSSLPPLRGTSLTLITSLLFLSNSKWIFFLMHWWYSSLSDSFQLVFSENCPMCRYILMCSWWEVKFYVLLLYHLYLPFLHFIFFLSLRINNSNCPIFKLANSLNFCLLKSARLLKKIFILIFFVSSVTVLFRISFF